MFEWFERIGTGVDVASTLNSIQKSIGLHSRIGSNSELGRPSSVLYKIQKHDIVFAILTVAGTQVIR